MIVCHPDSPDSMILLIVFHPDSPDSMITLIAAPTNQTRVSLCMSCMFVTLCVFRELCERVHVCVCVCVCVCGGALWFAFCVCVCVCVYRCMVCQRQLSKSYMVIF